MSRRGWLLFAAVGIIWGVPYLLIKVAVGALSPASLVFWRTALAALLLLPLAASRGQLRPLLRHWRALLVFAAVLAGGRVTLCTQCAARRGITADDVIDGVRIAGAAVFVEEATGEGAQALVY